jgi:hypothetical protein
MLLPNYTCPSRLAFDWTDESKEELVAHRILNHRIRGGSCQGTTEAMLEIRMADELGSDLVCVKLQGTCRLSRQRVMCWPMRTQE